MSFGTEKFRKDIMDQRVKFTIIDVLIGLVGLFVLIMSIYLGLWVCFLGGLVGIINEIKAPVTTNGGIVWSIIKVLISTFVTLGGLTLGILVACYGFAGGATERSRTLAKRK